MQESLDSAVDSLLTVRLTAFLAELQSQLAVHSSLLSQSTATLRQQVSETLHHTHTHTHTHTHHFEIFVVQLQSHREWVSRSVDEQSQRIIELSSAVQRENSQQVSLSLSLSLGHALNFGFLLASKHGASSAVHLSYFGNSQSPFRCEYSSECCVHLRLFLCSFSVEATEAVSDG